MCPVSFALFWALLGFAIGLFGFAIGLFWGFLGGAVWGRK